MKKKRRTYIEPKKQKGKQGRILAVCHLDMIFFVSFFVGILWANFIGDSSKNRFFMLNEYYLQQLKYAKLDYNRLFLYILENRLPLFGVLLLLSFTVVGILIQILFILYFGVSFGFLCVMAITNFGWKGILYMGGFLFPLHILYCRLSAIFKNILEKERGHGDDAKRAGDADRNDSIVVCDRSIGGKLCKPNIFKENVKNILNRYYKIWYRRNGMISICGSSMKSLKIRGKLSVAFLEIVHYNSS